MALIEEFLTEIDRLWKPEAPGKIPLRIIGSAALMLQDDYERGTKDGDVLETKDITPAVKDQLLALAGISKYKRFTGAFAGEYAANTRKYRENTHSKRINIVVFLGASCDLTSYGTS